jgi:hypothetical protein
MRLLLASLLAALPALAVSPLPQAPSAPSLEWRGQYQGEPSPAAATVMDAHRWARLWRSLDQPAPPLDFARYFAVVAFAGEEPTGGYTIEFLPPVVQGDGLLIQWRVKAPSPETYTTQAIAHPWKVKAFPRVAGAVKVEQAPH